jgi:hypothetical protein
MVTFAIIPVIPQTGKCQRGIIGAMYEIGLFTVFLVPLVKPIGGY